MDSCLNKIPTLQAEVLCFLDIGLGLFRYIFFSPNGIIFRSYNQIVHIVFVEVHGLYDIHLCEYCILLYYIFIDAFPSIYLSYCIVRLWLYHFDPAFFPSIIYSFIPSSTIFSSSCHPFIWPALLFCRRRWTIIFWPCEYDLTSEKSALNSTDPNRTLHQGIFVDVESCEYFFYLLVSLSAVRLSEC